jgi:transcriptional regulator with XRE-family HTH domain
VESKDIETLGQRLRCRRLDRGWSLRELADMTGISYTHLAKLERDGVPYPGYRTIEKLAEALGFTKEQLMGKEEPSATT